mgnify:CR=1 FL=1
MEKAIPVTRAPWRVASSSTNPMIGVPRQQSGYPFPAGGVSAIGTRLMQLTMIKISAAVITTLIASLVFLMITDAGHEIRPGIESAHPMKISAQLTDAASSDPETGKPPAYSATQSPAEKVIAREPFIESPNSKSPAGTAATDDTGWLAMLYPDLVRIARLEEGDPDSALAGLMPLLSDGDPVVRLAALEAVADMNHAASLPLLLTALDDAEAQIRVAALEALIRHRNSAAASVIAVLVYDNDADVRVAAIDALAAFGEPNSVHVLAGLLTDQDRRVRISAVAALGEIGGEDAAIYLRQLVHDPDDSIRASSIAILGETGLTVDH